MIDDFYNEQEQWERVKRWLRENGPWLVAGVVIGLGALAGWRWWETRVERRAQEASAAYQAALGTLGGNDRAAGMKEIDALRAEYPSSPYADQGDLLAARVHIDTGELGEAVKRFERVMNGSSDPQLQRVARARLARVQIAQGNADAALATLAGAEADGFAALFADIRGDALHAKGDRAGALAAWREAEKGATPQNGLPTVDAEGLRLKIADGVADGVTASAAAGTATVASPADAAAGKP